ncbi:hypothetical protein [Marinilactibacillus kalidii]|uniref:hypothetical protein n=1 Tax=Marinilactibacillus kalidii TaxID=2820274 RepID=UPI001ABE9C60|nr:hypothetical protein [Marinilactibacillus kalidii]
MEGKMDMYSDDEKREIEKIIKKADKIDLGNQFALTLGCLGPIAWLLSGFAPEKTQLLALLSIPTLIFIGYIWTNHFLQKEIIKLSREIDDLNSELARVK